MNGNKIKKQNIDILGAKGYSEFMKILGAKGN
jgi:hypothetical protein